MGVDIAVLASIGCKVIWAGISVFALADGHTNTPVALLSDPNLFPSHSFPLFCAEAPNLLETRTKPERCSQSLKLGRSRPGSARVSIGWMTVEVYTQWFRHREVPGSASSAGDNDECNENLGGLHG
jgi:hypothetical protein